jgi:hypothetical protein
MSANASLPATISDSMVSMICSPWSAVALALFFTGLACSRTPMNEQHVTDGSGAGGGVSTVPSGGTSGTIGGTIGGAVTAGSSADFGGAAGGGGTGGVSGGTSASQGGRDDGGVLGGTRGPTGGQSFGGSFTTSGGGIGGATSIGQAGVTTSGGGGGAGGLGGGGGSGGTGGACAPASTLPCTCDNGMSGSFVCLPNQVFSECVCGTPALMRVRNGVIGTWTGTATTPWVAPYPVTFTFDSYSHYSAKCLQSGCIALYYGTDEDSPLKQYDITDIQANGDADGTIDLVYNASGPADSPTQEDLKGISLSADTSRLQFYFMHFGEYGPLQYDLQRDPS